MWRGSVVTHQARHLSPGTALCIVALGVYSADPEPLRLDDLTVGGLALHADTAAVRAKFGPPRKVYPDSTIEGEGLRLLLWTYADVAFSFDTAGALFRTHLTGPSIPTRRGLRVGDPLGRVMELYGSPHDRSMDGRVLLYRPSPTPSRQLAMHINARGAIVTAIYLGHVVTLD